MKKTLSLFVAAMVCLPLMIQANSTGRTYYPDTVNYPWQRMAPPMPPMWNAGNVYRPWFAAPRFPAAPGMISPGFNPQPYPGYRPPMNPYAYRMPPRPAPMGRWQGPQINPVYNNGFVANRGMLPLGYAPGFNRPTYQPGMQYRPSATMNPYAYRMPPRSAPMAQWRGPQGSPFYNNSYPAGRGMPPMAYAGRFNQQAYPAYHPGMQQYRPPAMMNPYAYRMPPQNYGPMAQWQGPQGRPVYNNGFPPGRNMPPMAYAGGFNQPAYQPGMQYRPPVMMNPYAYRMSPQNYAPMAQRHMPQQNTSYRPTAYRPVPPAGFANRPDTRPSGYAGRWNSGQAYRSQNIAQYRNSGYPPQVSQYPARVIPGFNNPRYGYQQAAQTPYRPHMWQMPENNRQRWASPVNGMARSQPPMHNMSAYNQQAIPVQNSYARWGNQSRNAFPARKASFLN